MANLHQLKNIEGKIFSRLTVLKFFKIKGRRSFWFCQCSCKDKTIKIICGSDLVTGHTRSCGCLKREASLKKKHGGHGTKEYHAWMAMRARCSNENYEHSHRYIGRGITVCKDWDEFSNFYRDMGDAPSKDHSLDRIENDKGYYKENCRWATQKQQANNRSTTPLEMVDGIKMNKTEMAKYIRINPSTIQRYKKRGYTGQQINDLFKHKKSA